MCNKLSGRGSSSNRVLPVPGLVVNHAGEIFDRQGCPLDRGAGEDTAIEQRLHFPRARLRKVVPAGTACLQICGVKVMPAGRHKSAHCPMPARQQHRQGSVSRLPAYADRGQRRHLLQGTPPREKKRKGISRACAG